MLNGGAVIVPLKVPQQANASVTMSFKISVAKLTTIAIEQKIQSYADLDTEICIAFPLVDRPAVVGFAINAVSAAALKLR